MPAYLGDLAVEARVPERARRALIGRGHKLRATPSWLLDADAGFVIDAGHRGAERGI